MNDEPEKTEASYGHIPYGGMEAGRAPVEENLKFVSDYLVAKLPAAFGAKMIGRPFIENGQVAIDFNIADFNRTTANHFIGAMNKTFPVPGHAPALSLNAEGDTLKLRLAMDAQRARQCIRNYDRTYIAATETTGRGAAGRA